MKLKKTWRTFSVKWLLCALILLGSHSLYGQGYPFIRDFADGKILLKDSTQKPGQVKWNLNQNDKLRFRENEKAETQKYSPDDILGFSVDTLTFISLFNLELYAENYAFLGKTTRIKQTFGKLLYAGRINIYQVMVTGYDAVSSSIQTYINFYFEKKAEAKPAMQPFPLPPG